MKYQNVWSRRQLLTLEYANWIPWTLSLRNTWSGTVLAKMVGICLLNGSLTVPTIPDWSPPFHRLSGENDDPVSKLVVQQMPLKSVESRTVPLNRFPSPPRSLISNPVQLSMSSGWAKGLERIPTNPPLFTEVTVPFHMPVLLSKVDSDAPPITTSSKGENLKKFDSVDPGHQITSPEIVKRRRQGETNPEAITFQMYFFYKSEN